MRSRTLGFSRIRQKSYTKYRTQRLLHYMFLPLDLKELEHVCIQSKDNHVTSEAILEAHQTGAHRVHLRGRECCDLYE